MGRYPVNIIYRLYSIWNADFAEGIDLYSLRATHKLENIFFALVGYKMFVSAQLYAEYFHKIRALHLRMMELEKDSDKTLKEEDLSLSSQHNEELRATLLKTKSTSMLSDHYDQFNFK